MRGFPFAMLITFLCLVAKSTIEAFSMAELVPTSIHQRRRLSSSPLVTAARTLAASLSQTRLLQSTLSQGGGFSSVASSSSSSTFDWYKEWYPLVPVDLLDTEIPHKFTLFGVDIVVWKDSPLMMSNSGKSVSSFGPKPAKRKRSEDGEWRAFVDECPHRLVPLSEGRVENDGSLLCSYHAWRFNGTGHLIDVPQLESSLSIERLKDNPRSRCNSFPTRVVDGVLWVWPQTGDDARIESALKSVSKYQVPEGIDVSRVWFGPWDFRVLPYGADFFFENVVDPAHVQVSHHGFVGSRYSHQKRRFYLKEGLSENGFALETFNYNNAFPDMVGEYTRNIFKAPGCVVVENDYKGNATFVLELMASPATPGFCNYVGRSVIIKDTKGRAPKFLRPQMISVPPWVSHLMTTVFLNQDALFLHQQERHLAKTGKYASFRRQHDDEHSVVDYKLVTLTNEADRGVLAFRDWLAKIAGGYIPYKGNPHMPESSHEVVFDVWNGHTKHCIHCQRGLRHCRRVRKFAFLLAMCVGVLRPANKFVSLFASCAFVGVGLALDRVIRLFHRCEFSHGYND